MNSYFEIYQDKRIEQCIEPRGALKKIDFKDDKEEIENMATQLFLTEKKENEYVDYIERPGLLISDNLKEVFEKYKEEIISRPVVLSDKKNKKQTVYWQIAIKAIDCISDKSEFDKNGTLKKLVIDEKKAGLKRIFKVKGILENIIIIRLDVAESILRRDFTGIALKRIEKS
jgi:predicted RNA-binding protein